MENLPLFTGFCTCQVVQDFFHQQYGDVFVYFPIVEASKTAMKVSD